MQKKSHGFVLALLSASLLVAPLAEAKRAGGGKSYGMSRSNNSQNYQQQRPVQQQPAQQQAPAQQQPQRGGSNVGGMVAAGVAGAAIGAVAANAMADDGTRQADPNQQAANQYNENTAEQKQGGMNWLWVLLLIGGAVFLFRKLAAKKKLATGTTHNPYAPNNTGATRRQTADFSASTATSNPTSTGNTNIFGQSLGGATASPASFGATMSSGNPLPDGTEPAAFLRFARQRFNHIQAMNNASNINEIEKYFTADMYQSMYSEIANNDEVAEFSNLNASIIDIAEENQQFIVSVRFTGTVSEDLTSLPLPFSETWHFVKDVGSSEEWLVSGIQQD